MKLTLFAISLLLPALVYADNVIVTSTKVVEAAPTCDLAVYATGELIGGKLSLTNAVRSQADSGVISWVEITDKAKQGINLEVIFFDADPTATTFTDQSAFAPNNTDLLNIVCVAQVSTHVAFSANGVSFVNNVNCPFVLTDSTTLYAAIVSRGAPDYASTSDLLLRVGILQD